MEQLRALGPLAVILLCASCGGVTERRNDSGDTPPASCGLQTQFADDEACLTAPDPGSGFSLHFGPDDYDNPGPFMIESGDEVYDCTIVGLPTSVPAFVERWVARSRSSVADFEILAAPAGTDPCTDHRARLLAVSENGRLDLRVGAAPEYAGAAMRIGPGERIAIQVHALNPHPSAVLREVWINAHTLPESEVRAVVDTLALFSTTQPGTTDAFGGRCTVPAERPLLALSGHIHPDFETLEVFRVREGERTFLYRQRDRDSRFLRYDSVSLNPDQGNDPESVVGASGPVVLLAGDAIEWSCLKDSAVGLQTPPFGRERVCALRGWYLPSDGHWVCLP